MASTILRITVNNDSGTPAAPVGDGTTINALLFTQLQDNIDEFFARSSKTVAGVWTWETVGTHLFSASGSGANTVRARNTNAGTSNKGAVEVMGDAAQVTRLEHLSSTFTASGTTLADMGRLINNSTNGLNIEASTLIRLVQTAGVALHGSTLSGGSILHQTGGSGAGFNGVVLASNIKDFSTGSGGTTGTQGNASLESWAVDIGGTFGTGGPSIADGFNISRRPAGGSWASLLSLTTSGLFTSTIGVGNGTAAVPTYAFINDPDCGLFRVTTNVVGMATAGVQRTQWRANGVFRHSGGLALDNRISPAALPSGATNDWSPTGIEEAAVVRVSTNGGGSTLNGINSAAMNDGQCLRLVNIGPGSLSLADENGASSAANRFIGAGVGGSVSVSVGRFVDIWYDIDSSRWRVAMT